MEYNDEVSRNNRFVDVTQVQRTVSTDTSSVGRSNDFSNPNDGSFDPRHLYGTSNFDVFRWPSVTDGLERQMLGAFITSILLPGLPLVSEPPSMRLCY